MNRRAGASGGGQPDGGSGQLRLRILLVEDDRTLRIPVCDALIDAGHQVTEVGAVPPALQALHREPFDLLLTDVRLPGGDGIALFRELRRLQPDCACILMTAFGRVDDAVAVMRERAQDYITKPFEIRELLERIALAAAELRLKQAMADGCGCPCRQTSQLVGESPAIRLAQQQMMAAAAADVNVLIVGETGTGKALCARNLHCQGPRASRPFVEVNCAAIPGELFEAEMFGHELGAFTGAVRKRQGRLLAAHQGTLFLDEVGELSLEHQAKLLRVLESGRFEPVGSSQSVEVDVRVLAATNRDLEQSVEEGSFRRDLFFRLQVIGLTMVPLRERRGDIPLLVEEFLRRAALRHGSPAPGLSPAALAALMAYSYPGNVRELFHALEHGVAMARDLTIQLRHLPRAFQYAELKGPGEETDAPLPLEQAIREFERNYVLRVLEQVGGRRADAARLLGISSKILRQRLKD